MNKATPPAQGHADMNYIANRNGGLLGSLEAMRRRETCIEEENEVIATMLAMTEEIAWLRETLRVLVTFAKPTCMNDEKWLAKAHELLADNQAIST